MAIKERVMQLLEYKHIAKENFFIQIGMTSANFRGNAKYTPLNSTAIANIFSIVPDVSLEWLITGEGAMIKSKQNTADNSVLLDVIREKDTRIEQLVRANERMSIELDLLKKNTVTSTVSSMDMPTKSANVNL